MDSLEQAKTLYRKRHIHAASLTAKDVDNLALSISKLIRTSLTQQGGISSFRYLPFISVIQRTVTSTAFHAPQAARAFTQLERYLLLLLSQPWKREFWLLKTYGGFFRSKVKAHLDSPEEILQLVGYMPGDDDSPSTSTRTSKPGPSAAVAGSAASSSHNCLILDHPPDTEVMLCVAFDCQVAAEECLYIGDYYDKMRCVGLSLQDVLGVLLSGSPPVQFPPTVMAQTGRVRTHDHSRNAKGISSNNNSMTMEDLHNSKQKAVTTTSTHTTGAPPPLPPRDGTVGNVPRGTMVPAATTGLPVAHPIPQDMTLPTAGYTPPPASTHQQALYFPPGLNADLQHGLHSQSAQPHASVEGGGGCVARTGFLSSAASAQSSGYASGSTTADYGVSSVYSGPSCGNNNPPNPPASTTHHALPSSVYNTNYSNPYTGQPQQHHGGDYVDSPTAIHPPSSSSSASSRQQQQQQPIFPHHHPYHQQPLPSQHMFPATDFPYIDDDVPAFPITEGQVGGGGFIVGRGRGVSVHSEVLRTGGGVGRGVGSTSSGMVHRPGPGQQHQLHQQLSADRMRYPPTAQSSQPASAVLAMLTNTSTPTALDAGQQMQQQQADQSGHYVPLSALGQGQAQVSAMGGTQAGGSNAPNNHHHPGLATQPPSQPSLYHQQAPISALLPFHNYSGSYGSAASSSATSSSSPSGSLQSQKPLPPTFAQIAAAGKATTSEGQGLMARQAQGVSQAMANASSMDRGLAKSIISAGRPPPGSGGSSSEVILREKVGGAGARTRAGPVRGSSLVGAPSRTGSGRQGQEGFSRQSSQSMDLGMLKWRCRACTMENTALETICAACSKTRNAPDMPVPSAGESKRVCPACTFENQPGNTVCEVCENVLTDVHTYV